jgi:hypothetical protein
MGGGPGIHAGEDVHTEKFPCGNGLVEIVPCRSLMVWTIRTSPPIVISYLIDRRYLSSIALLELDPCACTPWLCWKDRARRAGMPPSCPHCDQPDVSLLRVGC